jgi:putative membrane protein
MIICNRRWLFAFQSKICNRQSAIHSCLPNFIKTKPMGLIIRILVTAVAAYLAAYLLKGVEISNYTTAIIVAVVLAILNTFVKPILVILTIPITIVTLGLFLLIINALMVKWAASLVDGFNVDGWWSALLFSLIVSVVSYILGSLVRDRD